MKPFDLDGPQLSNLTLRTSRIWERVREFTMTGVNRIEALIGIVSHISSCGVSGAMVECGVWRGGSVMAMALTLLEQGETNRALYLYDTFTGMSPPGKADVSVKGTIALERYAKTETSELGVHWCLSPLQEVKNNVAVTAYPFDKIHFVQGRLEDTLPSQSPGSIALLRLDTDWFESTNHALTHLYPLLVPGGFIIIDDYGHWAGARKAVDEYFEQHGVRPHFKYIDYSCIVGQRQ